MNKDELKSIVPLKRIEKVIYIIRSQKVILDQDLAVLYGVETKNLNKAVNRNQNRFPADFAFQLTKDEWDFLRFQIGTSNVGRGGRRYLPFAFTEYGVLMVANILKSKRAISISIEIVRAFAHLRQAIANHKEMNKELAEIKSFLLKHSHTNNKEFKNVWNAIDKLAKPLRDESKRKIGFNLS